MKKFYVKTASIPKLFFLVLILSMVASSSVNAQVRKAFSQRTSSYSPTKKIYSVTGDFAMIGNTNLTLRNYSLTGTNNYVDMKYVDVDNDNSTFNSSSATLNFSTENGAVPSCSNIVYAGLYWTGRSSDGNSSPMTFNVTKNGVTKTFDKRKISIKGPNASSYTTLTAKNSDIYYPETSDGFMYSAYAEVTDYVKANGIGSYSVADIALVEGNGGDTGFYGGWSLVVVYENAKMKYRDVTVFDGHAYIAGNVTAEFDLPISGFNAIQNGAVNMKLGIMAGEGDRPISGDYLKIQKLNTNNYVSLSHADNSTNNFFNSSIYTGGNARNPELANNTGLDISVFTVDNPNNTVIGNGQTSTKFKYGSTQDTYVIFATVMSVDAYIPRIEGLLSTTSVNGTPVPSGTTPTALPGQEIAYNVDIKNSGTEALNNSNIVIPIPYNATYVPGSAVGTILFSPAPTPNTVTFNPSLGANGSIVWNIGTLPLPADPNTLLGTLKFKLTTTTDCSILVNNSCANGLLLYGAITGVGAITNTALNEKPLIRYNQNGNCVGEPVSVPLRVNIDATNYVAQNCGSSSTVKNLTFCNLTGNTIPVSQVAGNFPNGSEFYSQYPVTSSTVEYNSSNPFPAVAGTSITYYAVPQNGGSCVFPFKITVCNPIIAQNDTIPSTNGTTGNTNAGSIFANNGSGADMLNGSQVVIANVNLTTVTPATPINGGPVPSINAAGNVVIPAGTPAGTYTITYQICEKANPSNCDTAVVTVPVTAAPIIAQDDNMPSVPGAAGNANAGSVFSNNGNGNDTLNGSPVALAQVNLTVTTPATPLAPGAPVPSVNASGNVVIPTGTPAGNYTITYQICEKLNPSNCDTAIVKVPVTAAPIIAQDDTMPSTNGTAGNTNAGSVFTNNGNGNDTLNGNPVALAQVNLTVTTPATPINGGPVPSVNASGNVVIPAGTPAGNYTITYQICEKLNPSNCDTAIVKVPVTAAPIIAQDDTMPSTNGTAGNTNAGSVFTNNGNGNDTLNGNPVALAQVNLTVTTPATPLAPGAPVPSVNASGNVVIPTGTPAGNYTITYQICEKLNPANCDTAIVTIPVTAAPIIAQDDIMPSIPGAAGNSNAGSVFNNNGNGNDTLNGNPVALAQVNLTVTTPATPLAPGAPVPSVNASGNVVIPAGTPAGTYTITYQICEKLNPSNCDTAIVTVPVTANPIIAQDDAMPSTNGLSGNTNAGSIFANNGSGADMLNGSQVAIANVNLTTVTPATPINGGPVPSINAAGNVVIPAGTPAGTYTITYQICEKLNPSNCDTAIVTVPVTAAPIIAQDDIMPSVPGAAGNNNAGSVFSNNGNGNDTLNGNPVALTQVNLTVVTPATPINGGPVPSVNASGNIVIPAGTPAGTYTITYQICEKLNPSNCDTAIVKIPVTANPIIAQDDNMPSTQGITGNPNAGSVFANNGGGADMLNGSQVVIANVNLTTVTPATPLFTGAPVPFINAAGNVVIPAGTPAGNYDITYQICEKLNPSNCDTAIVKIPVTANPIIAQDDSMPSTNGLSGNTNAGSIFNNNGSGADMLNGSQVAIANVNLTTVTPATPINGGPVPSINAAGNVVIPAGTPAGTYTITYQICEKLNPANCDTAIVTVPVTAAPIIAQDDSMPSTNGTAGNTNAGSVFTNNGNGNDTLNGNPVALAQVNLTVTTPATPLAPGAPIPSVSAAGNVVIPAGTPAGTYTITYQICEKLNPANCDTAIVTVPVTAAPIIAQDDSMPSTNGTAGNTNAGSVFANNGNGNDTLNGNPVALAQVNLTVTTPATPLAPGAPVPSVSAAGNVVIPAGTPAGTYTITYQICEKLNPANCDTAIVTVPVTAAPIIAQDDSMPSTNGTAGNTNAGSVFTNNGNGNDTLNGNPVALAQVNLTVTTPATPLAPGAPIPSVSAAGNVVIPAGTPAGTYTITYQICEKLNPANCDTAIVTVPVTAAPIIAQDDSMPSTNGTAGNTNAGSVFANNGNGNDTLNGNPVALAQVNLTVTTPATPLAPGAPVPSVSAAGNVVIPAGTPAGTYTITYQICEKLNPANCDTAIVTVPVTAAPIIAQDDSMPSTNGTAGNTNAGSVFTNNGNGNDTLNGNPVALAQVNLTVTTPATPLAPGAPIPSVSAAGNVVIPAGTPAGTYTITYQICEKLNPANCDTAIVTVPVTAAPIIAQDDSMPSTNGTAGNANAGSVFANNGNGNDTLNGSPVALAQVNLTVTTPATPLAPGAPVPSVNASGNVVIPAGTPAGTYTITYQICEKLNPANCDTAIVTVPVTAAPIIAQDDSMPSTNGTAGNANAGSVFANNGNGNDTLNGSPVALAQVNLTVTTPATPLAPGAPVPSVNASGNVVIPAGTPAGTYTITYQICEKLNPANCDTAIVTVPVYTPSIQLLKEGVYADTNLPSGVSVGDKINYTFTVINTGGAVLTNITVTDPNVTVVGGPLATLPIGASDSTTFTAVHTITQADIDAGQVNNLAIATGTPPAGNPVTDESSDPTPCATCDPVPGCPDCTSTELPQNPAISITKDGTYVDANADGITNVGDTVTYAFVIKNTGNVTLTNVTVADNNAVVTGGPIAVLPVGATDSTTFTAVHTITQADIDAGQVNNLAIATGTPPAGNPVTDESSDPTPCATCDPVPGCPDCTSTELPQNPAISITKDGTYVDANADGITNVGDTVTYAFVIKNTGNVTLTNVTVADNNAVVTGGPIAVLPVGATDSTTFTAVHTITQADIDAGQVNNLAIATGTPPAGNPVTDESSDPTPCATCDPVPGCPDCTSTELPQNPAISITKDGTYVDANADGITNVGDTVTYAFVIKNTGNVTLTNVTVTDNNAVVTGGPIAVLPVGATDSTTFTAVHTITQADIDAGQVNNLAIATGTPPAGNPVTDESSDPTPCATCDPVPGCPDCTSTELPQNPAISITKDGTYVDANADGITNVGDTVTYAFVIKNTGNVTLTNVTVTDNNAVVTGGPIAVLPVGATDSTTFTAVHTITQADIDAGQVNNLAIATGTPPAGNPVTDESSDPTPCATCDPVPGCPDCTSTELPQNPAISITKDGTYVDANADGITNVGDTVTYAFVIKNTGNVTLTNVTVTDNNAVVTGGPIAVLPVGATDSTTFTAVHTITQADIDAGQVNNLAIATGTPPAGNPVTDESSDPTPCATCDPVPGCPDCTSTPLINAVDDNFINIACNATSVIGNVLVNDTFGNTPVNTNASNQVILTVLSGNNANINIDNNGNINVLSGLAAGVYTITYKICGVTPSNICDQATVTINVVDTTAPIFVETLPTDSTVECSNVPTAPVLTATDSCGTATVTFVETRTDGNCIGNYILTRTWTATDASGNTTIHIQTITVQDNTAPAFVEALPADIAASCDNIPAAAVLTATDACGTAAVTFAETRTDGSCPSSYVLARTWTATDLCGNTAVHTQNITVTDTQAPAFVEALPADIAASCDNIPAAAVLTATDACGSATVTFAETRTDGACAGNYSLTRTWTATDLCGNTAQHVQTVTVTDTQAPAFVETVPADVTVACGSIPAAATLTATDACGSATVTMAESTTNGACAGDSVITRTWTATDLCGNTTSVTQTITVEDNTAPAFEGTLPASEIAATCGSIPAAAVLTATDACGSATVTFAETRTDGACAGSYSLTRTWTATDLCGNTAQHVQTVTVTDTQAPAFEGTLPASEIAASCGSIPAAVTLTATDACGSATVTFTETRTDGACAGSYSLIRTWTATDLCGNTAQHVQTVTVTDTQAPAFEGTLPASEIAATCGSIPAAATLTATDACGSATVTFAETRTDGACAGSYSLTRTWTATDLCGNTAQYVQTVTVTDTQAPAFVETVPADVTVACGSIPAAATLTATDACGSATVTMAESTTNGACAGDSVITRTWTATDLCGNTTSVTQTITVQDNTAPAFVETVPADVTVACGSIPAAATLTATDACGSATVTMAESTTNGACAGDSVITRTWTATDLCGNTTSVTQTITVEDNTAPAFVETVPADVTVACGSIPAAATLTATDNCSLATVTMAESTANGACAGDSIITRTWTATDLCGNTTSVTQTITVEDNTAPTLVTPFEGTINVVCSAIPTAPALQFTDSCSSVENVIFDEQIENQTATGYTIIRTWTASDSCGNSGVFTQTVNVTITSPTQTIPSELCVEDLSIDLFTLLDGSVETTGTWMDTNNSGGLQGSIFNPAQVAVGDYILSYVIADGDCPRTIQVNMNVNDDCIVLAPCEIVVHNAISPNGDTLNEFFKIDGIDCYPNNTVEIYNRWGVLVFDAHGYDNTTRVFRGVSEGRATVKKSEELPDGTYFYVLKYVDADGKSREKASYLYINR